MKNRGNEQTFGTNPSENSLNPAAHTYNDKVYNGFIEIDSF